MSAVEKLANHEDEMMKEIQHVQELMAKSLTGQEMMDRSIDMAGTDQMTALMVLIGDPNVSEKERMLLAQYMGEMLKRDPVEGMIMYSDYLKSTAENPQYAARRDYYLSLSDAALAVHESSAYQAYIIAYKEFENDKSAAAQEAREATEAMQAKMRQWAEV